MVILLQKGEQNSTDLGTLEVIDSIIDHSVVSPQFHKFDEAVDFASRELDRMIEDPYNLQDRLQRLDRSIKETLR